MGRWTLLDIWHNDPNLDITAILAQAHSRERE